MMNRARASPSSATTWSSEAIQSSVSSGSMSGSWCLNSSKYIMVSVAHLARFRQSRDGRGRVSDATRLQQLLQNADHSRDGRHRMLPVTTRHITVTMHAFREMTMRTQPLILVADDEPRITKLVSIALGEEGFRVVTANSGEEALQKAEEIRPHIILLDIVMPDLDGIEVMRQLRERRPVAVILLTAKGSTADKAKGLDL